MANYASLAFIEMAMIALLPLFYSSPIEHGGLNLSPSTIGILLGTFGLVNGFFQAFFFAKIVKRCGAKNLFIAGMSCFLPIFLLFPVMNLLALRWGVSPIVWVIVAFQLMIAIVMDMSYGENHSHFSLSLTSNSNQQPPYLYSSYRPPQISALWEPRMVWARLWSLSSEQLGQQCLPRYSPFHSRKICWEATRYTLFFLLYQALPYYWLYACPTSLGREIERSLTASPLIVLLTAQH